MLINIEAATRTVHPSALPLLLHMPAHMDHVLHLSPSVTHLYICWLSRSLHWRTCFASVFILYSLIYLSFYPLQLKYISLLVLFFVISVFVFPFSALVFHSPDSSSVQWLKSFPKTASSCGPSLTF